MKSKIEDLQCPCGCELGADHRAERLYRELSKEGFDVRGLVDCSRGNTQLRVECKGTADGYAKKIDSVCRQLGLTCGAYYYPAQDKWILDVSSNDGVMYA